MLAALHDRAVTPIAALAMSRAARALAWCMAALEWQDRLVPQAGHPRSHGILTGDRVARPERPHRCDS